MIFEGPRNWNLGYNNLKKEINYLKDVKKKINKLNIYYI